MNDVIDEVVQAVPGVIARVEAELPHGFPAQVFESITAGLKRTSRRLAP